MRTVRVTDWDAPGLVARVTVRWLCPVPTCRRPRGEPDLRRLVHHDGDGREIATVRVDHWRNECGHHDLYRDVLAEGREHDRVRAQAVAEFRRRTA